jgi:hypothetical protein
MENLIGQIGLALTAVFGLAVLHKTNAITPRPGWPYFVSIWGVSVVATLLLSNALQSPAYYRIMVGLMMVSVYFRYQVVGLAPHEGVARVIISYFNRPIGQAWVARINTYLWGGIGIVLVLASVYWVRNWQQTQTATLRGEIRKTGAVAQKAVTLSTARTVEMQATIDSLTRQLSLVQQEGVKREKQSEKQINALRQQINELTALLIDLRRLIKSVGNNVERSRRSNIDIPSSLQPNSSNFYLPTDKVKPIPLYKRGRKVGFDGDFYETEIIAGPPFPLFNSDQQ